MKHSVLLPFVNICLKEEKLFQFTKIYHNLTINISIRHFLIACTLSDIVTYLVLLFFHKMFESHHSFLKHFSNMARQIRTQTLNIFWTTEGPKVKYEKYFSSLLKDFLHQKLWQTLDWLFVKVKILWIVLPTLNLAILYLGSVYKWEYILARWDPKLVRFWWKTTQWKQMDL